MMFMSMVVHVVEFVVVSLLAIMFYKLFISYKNWKTVSAFSAKPTNQKISVATRLVAENNSSDQSLGIDRSDYLSVNKISVSESKANSPLQEKKPSAILDDYIGGFFTESESIDINAYRSDTTSTSNSPNTEKIEPLASEDADPIHALSPDSTIQIESDVEDDFIKVQSANAVQSVSANNEEGVIEKNIPTLKEFTDIESDSFITVASVNDEKADHKVMSDKVVLAMLDEAKLVCAS